MFSNAVLVAYFEKRVKSVINLLAAGAVPTPTPSFFITLQTADYSSTPDGNSRARLTQNARGTHMSAANMFFDA